MTLADVHHLDPRQSALPSNLEAEQALLGAVLFDNTALHRIEVEVMPDHFNEPFHGRMWFAMADGIGKGVLVEPIGLLSLFREDPAFQELGGIRYLADLVDRAPPASEAPHYAGLVHAMATRRELIRIGDEIGRRARLDYGSDAAAMLEEAESALLGIHRDGGRHRLTTAAEAASGVLSWLDTPTADAGGVLTGLGPLDEHLGPLLAGDLVVLAGRPAMGKSAMGGVIAANVACPDLDAFCAGERQDFRVAGVIEINGEMSVGQMARRHLTDIAQRLYQSGAPSYSDIRRRRIGDIARSRLGRAAEVFGALPVMSLKRTGMTLSALRMVIRRQMSTWERAGIPTGLVVIDHVGLLKADDPRMSRYEAQTAISNGLKELADELAIPILALAQLNRETEKRDSKRPTLADLRDSGAWEQDADVVIGVYRDAYYAQKEPEPKDTGKPDSRLEWGEWDRRRKSKTIEAVLLKVREGDTGTVELWGDMRTNAIRAAAPENDGGFL